MQVLSCDASERPPCRRASSRRGVSLARAFTSLVAATAGIFLALLGTGGTYALWSGEESLEGSTVTSGILDLDVLGTVDSAHWSKLLPGEHHVQFVTVENTGNIPHALSALATQDDGDDGSFELRLELVASDETCATPIAGTDALGTQVGLGTILASETAHLCIDVTLSSSALPGHDAEFELELTADQVT